jgi:hypothetical protein
MTSGWVPYTSPLGFGASIGTIAVVGFLVLWYDSPDHGVWRHAVRTAAERLTGRSDLSWIDAPLLTAVAACSFAAAAIATWVVGGYGCTPSGPSDLTTLVTSGHAFLHGGDPFTITACGISTNPVPAGLASVLLDALGSLAGPAGVLVVWGTVSAAVIPLLWSIGGADRAVATVFVLSSFLYLPIVAVQIDGASLALVPVAVLFVLFLARRGWPTAAAVGGLLSTGRFPAVFPILGASGRAGPRRLAAAAAAVGVFGTVSAATFLAYGSRFTGPVFWMQFGRSNFALNYWGLLQAEHWLGPSTAVTVVQASLTVVLVAVVWARARSPLGAVALVLTGTILLAQFLSFTELVFLVPVALVGVRARWWLWAIGVVASTNYLLALRSLSWLGGPWRFSYALDLLLTALVVGLFVDLLRAELGVARPEAPTPTTVAGPTS